MERLQKINLREKLDSFRDTWSPKILAQANDVELKAVKIDGEFIWHHHGEEDEIFIVLHGQIDMHYMLNGNELVESFSAGELLCVPHGIEHKPVALPGTEILLIERVNTSNTGNVSDSDRHAQAQPI